MPGALIAHKGFDNSALDLGKHSPNHLQIKAQESSTLSNLCPLNTTHQACSTPDLSWRQHTQWRPACRIWAEAYDPGGVRPFLLRCWTFASFEPVVMTVKYFARVSRSHGEKKMDCVSWAQVPTSASSAPVTQSGSNLLSHSATSQQWGACWL